MLTRERLLEELTYDPSSGEFRWLKTDRMKRAGAIAGSLSKTGYVYIKFDRKMRKAHRLAWLYVYGEWPKGQIDHINRVRNDNRISNLRDVSNAVNGQNRSLRANNGSGYCGVSYHRTAKGWQAQITANGKGNYLGIFPTKEAAAEAYKAAKDRLHAPAHLPICEAELRRVTHRILAETSPGKVPQC